MKLLVDMTNLLLKSCVATVKTLCLLIDWMFFARNCGNKKAVVTTANQKI